MEEREDIRVKKLALAYRTGWQYQPGGAEAGSVLTDLFLEMEKENEKRFRRIWEKHRREFLSIVPEEGRETALRKAGLTVRLPSRAHGERLEAGSRVYTVLEDGGLLRFRTAEPVFLTAAALCCAVYQKGFSAWLSYEGGEETQPLRLFAPAGQKIARPEFRWYFPGLCGGRETFCFAVRFSGEMSFQSALPGEWSIRDGKSCCEAEWKQKDGEFFLCGESGRLAEGLETERCELCLSMEEEPAQEWLDALYGGFVLETAAETFLPELCLTEAGGCPARQVYPFGRAPQEADCCYIACDTAAAGGGGEITLSFAERCEREERLPLPPAAGDEKFYKKYPWLRRTEEISEWRAEKTVWEYFNGSFWCVLPESAEWKTGCQAQEAAERRLRWRKPADMRPCVVEGEEHFYLRLRLESVRNAYAAYYRKYIPVLENIRFSVEEQRIDPVGQSLPDRSAAGERKMYLGFDREVVPENRWYAGGESFSFRKEQLKGWGCRFGREAFWAELEAGEERSLPQLLPNYVEALQECGEEDGGEGGNFAGTAPAGSLYYVETRELGTLEAVSVSDVRCAGPEEESVLSAPEAQDYFSHYGRLVTELDLELMLRQQFPGWRVVSCSSAKNGGELRVEVEAAGPTAEVTPGRGAEGTTGRGAERITESGAEPEKASELEENPEKLRELEEWLRALIARKGGLWLQGVPVRCRFAGGRRGEKQKGGENECQIG